MYLEINLQASKWDYQALTRIYLVHKKSKNWIQLKILPIKLVFYSDTKIL